MPCRDYDSDAERIAALEARIHALTVLLCTACQLLERTDEKMTKDLKAWWDNHQNEDRKAEEAKRRRNLRAELRKRALKKLTPDEREALDL